METDSSPHFALDSDCALAIRYETSLADLHQGFRELNFVPANPELLEILSGLSSLTDSFIRDDQSLQRGPNYTMASLRCRLLLTSDSKLTKCPDLVAEACRIGALLFLRTTLFHYPAVGQPYSPLLRKLKLHFESDTRSYEGHLKISLWLAVLASMLALPGPLQDFFLGHLRLVAAQLRIESWEEARGILETFLWVERIQGKAGLGIWKQV